MKYEVKTVREKTFEGASEGKISNDNWNTGNVCDCGFKMVYVENKGFYIRLEALEPNPIRHVTVDGGTVWEDSCLEFFPQFAPDKTEEFINFEFSAAGGMLAGLGIDRHNRRELTHFYSALERKVEVTDSGWSLTAFIPNEAIYEVYGKIDFKKGYKFRANFFKCCEEEGFTHFLSWAPLPPERDFHRRECFGTIELV